MNKFPYPDDVQLIHEHGGNGWAMVAWYPENDYCHLAQVHADGVSDRAYLAWVKKLRPAMKHVDMNKPELGQVPVKISELAMIKVKELRSDLLNGKKRIEQTYIK